MNIATNVRTLTSELNITREQARLVRKLWSKLTRQELLEQSDAAAELNRTSYNPHATRYLRRAAIAGLLTDFHGIEYLGIHKRSNDRVYYLNAGDPYATTLIFKGNRAFVGCWGDLVERNAIRTEG